MRSVVVQLVVVLLLSGCITTPPTPSTPPVEIGQDTDYQKAAVFEKEKKYSDAIAAFRRIADEQPRSPFAADSLFEAAYLQAFYDNPQKDYAQALAVFDEFLRRFPKHSKAREAKNWRAVLKVIIDMKAENERLNMSIEQLNKLDIRHEEMRREK